MFYAAAAAAAAAGLGIYLHRRWQRERNAPWIAAVRKIVDADNANPKHIDLPVPILDHLLLGDKRCAGDLATLEAFGVTHVLNVAGRYGSTEAGTALGSGHYLQISADDEEGYAIIERHLAEARSFIRKAREDGGRCLIHCQAGINRSGCLAVAELMLDQRLTVLEAVERGRLARGVILSNHSFQDQLVALARTHDLLGPCPEGMAAADAEARKPRKSAAEALRRL